MRAVREILIPNSKISEITADHPRIGALSRKMGKVGHGSGAICMHVGSTHPHMKFD